MEIVKGPIELSAGPVRLRFQDGELRYLTVNGLEIIRRIYFGVRTKSWDTVTPEFTEASVRKGKNSFVIDLTARCERPATNGFVTDAFYQWKGKIVGKADGTITFTATGKATQDFESNRIGLCVLYGTPTVLDRPYMVVGGQGLERTHKFPVAITPDLTFEKQFMTLGYAASNGMTVVTKLTGDAIFDMEDQRHFGDSSFKNYAPLGYKYPKIPMGVAKTETVTLSLINYKKGLKPATSNTVQMGKLTKERVPQLVSSVPKDSPDVGFFDVNAARKPADEVNFQFRPSIHLVDDDTFWDNLTTIPEQTALVRSFAPNARIIIGPIRLDGTNPRPHPDPRSTHAFGGAWAAGCIKQLALAGVTRAEFDLGEGVGTRVVEFFKANKYEGRRLRAVTITSPEVNPNFDAFYIEEDLILTNKTNKEQKITVPASQNVLYAKSITTEGRKEELTTKNRTVVVTLHPFEVVLLRSKA